MFRIEFNREANEKFRRLTPLLRGDSSAKLFWVEIASLLEHLAASPLKVGDVQYKHLHVDLTSYLVVRNFIAINYAVSDVLKIVIIERIMLSGGHPYPPKFEELLNQEPT